MDDPNAHNDEPLEKGHVDDPIETPEDTLEGDEPTNPEKAEEAAQKQEDKWLDDIRDGKKTPDDMPENLDWLKERVVKKLDKDGTPAAKPRAKAKPKVDVREQVRAEMREERAAEDFSLMVEDLGDAGLTAEQGAQLKDEYEDYLADIEKPTSSQKVKALHNARRLVGLKSNSEALKDRRRRGMSLPPEGGRKRSTVGKKEQMTQAEKDLEGDLPPGFSKPSKS